MEVVGAGYEHLKLKASGCETLGLEEIRKEEKRGTLWHLFSAGNRGDEMK